jgi:hypothetical protein
LPITVCSSSSKYSLIFFRPLIFFDAVESAKQKKVGRPPACATGGTSCRSMCLSTVVVPFRLVSYGY